MISRARQLGAPRAGWGRARASRRARGRASAVVDDPVGDRGAELAVVGVGTRGCALVDALEASRALSRAELWALHADVSALERSAAENRWRLPPQNVEVTVKAVEDNAASAARAVLGKEGRASGRPPRTVVVLCAGGEALESGEALVRELAREKAANVKRGFFGFKGATRPPEGGSMIAGVIEPFTFEGRRKQAACEEFLRCASGAGACDLVLTVSQSELLKNGEDGMSVQDATSVADASLLYSVLSSLDALRGSCWNSNFVGDASDVEAWVPQANKGALRTMVNKVMSARGGGCGVSHVGRGVGQVPTYGSIDEACASAARSAIFSAARESPFLAPGRFDTAALVVCTVKHGVSLGPIARATISQTLRELAPQAQQFISITDPDKRGTTEVEVSLLTVTDAATAAAAAPESATVAAALEEKRPKANAMLFVPGYEESAESPEKPRRKTTKLSREDLKKFGYGDMKTMVMELETARAAAAAPKEAMVERETTSPSGGEESTTNKEAAIVFTSTQLAGEPAADGAVITGDVGVSRIEVAPVAKLQLPPLPRDFTAKEVAVRISEPQRDASGNVIGYKTLDGKILDAASSSKLERVRSLFGWRPEKKKDEKSNLSKRAMGMLEKDRVGSDRAVVRVEYATLAVYEGEWMNGRREGDGRQVFAAGDWFDGKWHADLPDGKGRLTWKANAEFSYFEGMFNAGKIEGEGTLVKHSGERVVGIWREGALVSGDNPR